MEERWGTKRGEGGGERKGGEIGEGGRRWMEEGWWECCEAGQAGCTSGDQDIELCLICKVDGGS